MRVPRSHGPTIAALLGLLAFTACKGGDAAIQTTAMVSDSADHVMFGVVTVLTNLGVKQANLEADTAFMYEASSRAELRKIKLTFFSSAGVQQSVLTADSGTYHFRAQNMEARGNVVVVKTDGSRLVTSVLRFDQAKNEVSTDRHYTYDTGTSHLEGESFTSDPTFSNLTTRRARGTGSGFALPQ